MTILTLLFFSIAIALSSAAPVKNESDIWADTDNEYIEEEIWNDPWMVDVATCSQLLDDIESENRDPEMDIVNLPDFSLPEKDGQEGQMFVSGMHQQRLWPNCVVPVVLQKGMSKTQKRRIACAIRFFFEKTCIRFAHATKNDANIVYITTRNDDEIYGCKSEKLGMGSGWQHVNLQGDSPDCWIHANIIHELMHGIGFFHEQARNDRDNYVEIHWDQIPHNYRAQYYTAAQRELQQQLVGTYVYESIMHYPRFLPDTPYGATMTALQSPVDENNQKMGNRKAPTAMDVFKINELYNCASRDCKVSEWEVQGPCVFGKQIMTRRVLQEPLVNGTACPEQLRIVANCKSQVVCHQPVEGQDSVAAQILLIGGEDDEASFSAELYNPDNPRAGHVFNITLTTERKGHVSGVIGDEVITAGGVFSEYDHYAVTSEIYNYKLNHLTVGPALLEARGWSASAVLNSTFYICGGQQPEEIVASCEKLDNEKKGWQGVTPMTTPRARFAMATLGGHIYAMGGEMGVAEETNMVEKYDPILKQWTRVASMTMARSGHSAAALGDHLYVCGASMAGNGSSCERYSPKEDKWSPIKEMSYEREGLTLVAFQDRLVAIGGFWDHDGLNVQSYLPSENKWKPSPDTLKRRAYHTAVLI